MEDSDLWKMIGKIAGPLITVLLGALVAYGVQREHQRSKDGTGKDTDKPSLLREVSDRLKDPNKPTGR